MLKRNPSKERPSSRSRSEPPPVFLDDEDLKALGLTRGLPPPPEFKTATQDSHEDVVARVAGVVHGHLQGKSERDLVSEFKIPLSTVKMILSRVYSREIDFWRSQDARSLFARYSLNLLAIFRELQQQCESLVSDKESRQYNAFIQGKRAQIEILDKILDRGHRMGVLTTRPAPTEFVDGTPADQMSTRELEISLYRELTVLRAVVGDVSDARAFPKGFSLPWQPPDDSSPPQDAKPCSPCLRTARTITSDKPRRAVYLF